MEIKLSGINAAPLGIMYFKDSNSIATKINYCPMCGRRLMNRK